MKKSQYTLLGLAVLAAILGKSCKPAPSGGTVPPEELKGTIYFKPETPKVGVAQKLGIQDGNGTDGLYTFSVKKSKGGVVTEFKIFDNAGKEVDVGITPSDLEGYILNATVTNADTAGKLEKSSNPTAGPDPKIPDPTPKTLSFGKATISSPDKHLPSTWDALCGDVVSTLNTAYGSTSEPGTEIFFEYACADDGVEIVLVNSLATNWEVKQGNEKGKLYIKIGSISSITADSYMGAFMAVLYNNPATSTAKAAPKKDGVYLVGLPPVKQPAVRNGYVRYTKAMQRRDNNIVNHQGSRAIG